MDIKRLARVAGCLLLVCCLIFNMATIPARATGVEIAAVAIGVSALLVVGSILIGQGIGPGVSNEDFWTVANACVDYLTDAGTWVVDGLCTVAALTNHTYKYAVSQELVQEVHDWLFAEEIVTSGAVGTIPAYVFNDGVMERYEIAKTKNTAVLYYNTLGEQLMICYCNSGTIARVSYGSYDMLVCSCGYFDSYLFDSPAYTSRYLGNGTGITVNDYCVYEFCGLADAASLSTPYDLTVTVSAAQSVADAYADWAAAAVAVPGSVAGVDSDEDTIVYPLGLGGTLADTEALTQTQVQAGTGTYEATDSEAGTLTGTFADTAVGSFISSLVDALWAPFRWLGELLSSLWATLSGLFTTYIVEPVLLGIQAIFVPSEDFLTAKVEALRAEYAFADSIIATGEFIGDSLSGLETSPPIIYIDLGASRGSYELGGQVAFIDLTWYAEYKPTVDMLLSALLWIVFCWQMFKRLPGLISGVPGDFVMDGLNSIGLADHLPSRNAAYEIQRRSIRESIRRRGE